MSNSATENTSNTGMSLQSKPFLTFEAFVLALFPSLFPYSDLCISILAEFQRADEPQPPKQDEETMVSHVFFPFSVLYFISISF